MTSLFDPIHIVIIVGFVAAAIAVPSILLGSFLGSKNIQEKTNDKFSKKKFILLMIFLWLVSFWFVVSFLLGY